MLSAEQSATQWQHHNPVRVYCAAGSIERLRELVADRAKVLLVTTPGATSRGVTARVAACLGSSDVTVFDEVSPNPQLDHLDVAVRGLRNRDIDTIVAVGGGSALDTGKIFGVTLRSRASAPLAEVLRAGKPLTTDSNVPVIAIPTTAGSGAEVTPFATVWDSQHDRKHSLADERMYPTAALLDATLTLSLGKESTLYPALDAISHALESLWNRNRTPISEAVATRALALATDALPAVLESGGSLAHRSSMLEASLLAGFAISQTRTAIAHSISYPLTGRYGVPHGLASSFTLPALFDTIGGGRQAAVHLPREAGRAIQLVSRMRLASAVLAYVDADTIMRLGDCMLSPDRADNFVLEPSAAMVRDVLYRSLAERGPGD